MRRSLPIALLVAVLASQAVSLAQTSLDPGLQVELNIIAFDQQ